MPDIELFGDHAHDAAVQVRRRIESASWFGDVTTIETANIASPREPFLRVYATVSWWHVHGDDLLKLLRPMFGVEYVPISWYPRINA